MDTFKMDLPEIVFKDANWVNLTHNTVQRRDFVNTATKSDDLLKDEYFSAS
jgi:hypothetical protein